MIASRLLRHWFTRLMTPDTLIREKYGQFKRLLRADAEALDLIADLDNHLYGHDPADMARIRFLSARLIRMVRDMVSALTAMNPAEYADLAPKLDEMAADIALRTTRVALDQSSPYLISLDDAYSHPDKVGGKAANLSLARQAGAPTPPGYVITASAFARFMRDNGLESEVERRFRSVCLSDYNSIIRATGDMQELILAGDVPADIAAEILTATNQLIQDGSLLAVRSSALAEDGTISFAGQYASELGVRAEDVLSAYKRVLAGKYCPRAVAYRIRHGLSDNDTAMAVLVLPLVPAEAAGVVYTRDPACPTVGGEAMGVYVVAGLAAGLVDGTATPEKVYVTRDASPAFIPGCECSTGLSINEETLLELGQWCMKLETLFGLPQDVEWAWGQSGLYILQTRRLQQDVEKVAFSEHETDQGVVKIAGLECASPGAACGPVHHAQTGSSFRNIPHGSVVVTPTLRPALSQFLDRIAAVVAGSGSRASHLASVARERGVPVLVGYHDTLLENEELVTVDAAAGRIFSGCLPGVMTLERQAEENRALLRAEHETLARAMVRLNLTDPDSPDFTPAGCQSLHDVVRFCHEMSVAEMFSLVGRDGRGLGGSRKLRTELPLVMYVLDLGGGLADQTDAGGDVETSHLVGVPLRELWKGLSDSRIAWDQGQMHVDWEAFDRISAGLFRLDSRILASYAIIAADYMHLNIRFGYHFSVVDSVCGDTASANYVKFRFKGGGASLEQRGYRLLFVDAVLSCLGFENSIKGDMLDATFARMPVEDTMHALRFLGLVLAETRLMDMRMSSPEQATFEADAFLQRYGFKEKHVCERL